MSSAVNVFVACYSQALEKVPRAESGMFWFPWMDSHDSSAIQYRGFPIGWQTTSCTCLKFWPMRAARFKYHASSLLHRPKMETCVAAHCPHSLKASDIVEQLCLSERSVRRYIDLFQRTGDVKPCSQQHGPPKLLGEFEQVLLLRLIINNPGIYLHEIQQEWIPDLGSASVLPHSERL